MRAYRHHSKQGKKMDRGIHLAAAKNPFASSRVCVGVLLRTPTPPPMSVSTRGSFSPVRCQRRAELVRSTEHSHHNGVWQTWHGRLSKRDGDQESGSRIDVYFCFGQGWLVGTVLLKAPWPQEPLPSPPPLPPRRTVHSLLPPSSPPSKKTTRASLSTKR